MNRSSLPTSVPERKLTKWHNPTPNMQSVTINDGAPFAFTVPPGETRELDSRYDRAVQMVDCGHDYCTAGHEGLVVGGGAPLLKRMGKDDKLDPSLDPDHAARKSVEAQIDQEVERERILEGARARREKELLDAATKPAPSAQAHTQPTAAKK
jgi:hypothetical protein